MKKLLSLLAITCILSGCKKSSTEDENYTLSGIVLDFDSNTAIAGAKVYVREFRGTGTIVDSAVSDANGRVSFTYRKEGEFKFFYPAKASYLNAIHIIVYHPNYNDRLENLYLARPSFINVTTHKTSVYLPSDTIDIQINGDNVMPSGYYNSSYRTLLRDKAEAPDKVFNLQAIYGHPIGSFYFGSSKLYFVKNIIRNGAVLTSQSDSTNIIQFGTQNFTLNY